MSIICKLPIATWTDNAMLFSERDQTLRSCKSFTPCILYKLFWTSTKCKRLGVPAIQRWNFPHSWLITGFVTRLTIGVPLVDQVLLTLPEHLSSPPGFQWGSHYSIFSFICMFCRSLFAPVVLFLLAIVLPVLLRFTDSDYPFGIFKLFLTFNCICI